MFFMWSVAKQRYLVDRVKTIEFLIQAATECKQLNNFSSLLQLMSALEHGSVQRYKTAWELVPKNVRSTSCTMYSAFVHLCNKQARAHSKPQSQSKVTTPQYCTAHVYLQLCIMYSSLLQRCIKALYVMHGTS